MRLEVNCENLRQDWCCVKCLCWCFLFVDVLCQSQTAQPCDSCSSLLSSGWEGNHWESGSLHSSAGKVYSQSFIKDQLLSCKINIAKWRTGQRLDENPPYHNHSWHCAHQWSWCCSCWELYFQRPAKNWVHWLSNKKCELQEMFRILLCLPFEGTGSGQGLLES